MSPLFWFLAFLIIALLFKEDQKEWTGFSSRLWIPLAWLVVMTTRLVPILFPYGSRANSASDMIAGYSEGNPLIRIMLIFLIISGLVALRGHKTQCLLILHGCKSLGLLYSYSFLSIAWSAYPEISIKRFIKLIGLVIIALIIACDKEYHRAFEHIFRRYIIITLIISVFLLKLGKGTAYVLGRMGTKNIAGISFHKNELSISCAFFLVFLVWRVIRSQTRNFRFDILLIIVNVYFLVKTQSATGSSLAVIGIIAILILTLARENVKKILPISLIIFVPVLMILSMTVTSPIGNISGGILKSMNKDTSLTGRIPMWRALFRLGRGELLFGSGYESFWQENLPAVWEMFEFGPTNAHSGYFDIILNLGAVGIGLFLLFLISLVRRIVKGLDRLSAYRNLYIGFLIIVLVGNITESGFMVMSSLHWSLLVILSINTGWHTRHCATP